MIYNLTTELLQETHKRPYEEAIKTILQILQRWIRLVGSTDVAIYGLAHMTDSRLAHIIIASELARGNFGERLSGL